MINIKSRLHPSHLRARTAIGVTALTVAALPLSACGGGDGANGRVVQEPTARGDDPAAGHVHGLGVDPADGAVYAAAHFGLFKLGLKNTAQRVAGRYQDTMGFTVTGPRTFLASGHPAMKDMAAGSPHLGLIRSTDAGNTWSPVSEAGKADFHALQPADRNLYAYDSQTGRIRRSTDSGASWVIGARLNILDLAAHASRPDHVLATTPQGVQASDDGGATFAALPGAPTLTHLDEVDGKTLIGIDPDGQVRAAAAGGAWAPLGKVPGGQVTAFTAVDRLRVLAATENGTVHESRDGGRNFKPIYAPRT